MTDERLLVTGGAGLIGSHLASALVADGADVVVADDLSGGRRERVPDAVELVEADLTDADDVARVVTGGLDRVYHLAADSAVDADDRRAQVEANTAMTYNLLERMAEVGVDSLAFTSSSTVYGEAPLPTPEDYAPLEPISEYGAAKLADEALVSTYAHAYGVTARTFRFANVVGPGQRGNVIADFVEKLRDDPTTLEILGDGRQEKSYLHVEECVAAMRHVVREGEGPLVTVNLGSRTTTSVRRVADIVSDVLGVDPTYEYTGGDRGWTGDVPRMRLSVEKLSGMGFTPPGSSDEAVRRAAEALAEEI
ncbi:MAG: NAD-dependent epimerase/dehydratase family protein [Haloferacaceae archaeon]